jgi:hypothetical protein
MLELVNTINDTIDELNMFTRGVDEVCRRASRTSDVDDKAQSVQGVRRSLQFVLGCFFDTGKQDVLWLRKPTSRWR